MLSFVKNFVRDEEGATMIEYGLMVALIAVAMIVAIGTLTGGLDTLFTDVGDRLDTEAAKATAE